MSESVPVPDPFEKVTYGGKLMDRKTMVGLQVAEQRLGYTLTITQGCYNPGDVSSSAGTHDGGGVVDLAPYEADRKVRVLRDLGWAAWRRPTIPGLWPEHVHAVMIGHGRLSEAAQAQVQEYRAGGDGLAGSKPDPDPYRPSPLPIFDYRAALRDERLRERIAGLRARIKTLRDRISYKG